MREDMHKVLTERVRAGGRGKSHNAFDKVTTPREIRYVKGVGGKSVKVDLSPKRESIRKRHKVNYNNKELTDHLHPMERFLISRTGQPWDKVWSEICKVLKGNGMQANHVKDHVKNYVGGITHGGQKDSMWKSYRDQPESMYTLVYVDKDKILRKNENYNQRFWRKRPPKIYSHVDGGNNLEYHRINGCWYEINYTKASSPQHIADGLAYTKDNIVLTKKAINKRDAKKLDLENRLSHKPSKIFPEKK